METVTGMTKTEKWITYGILTVVGLEIIRHFTWRDKGVTVKPPFQPIGMSPYASVARRA